MFEIARATRSGPIAGLWLASAFLLAACGSEGPPEQTRTEPPALTGTATYGATIVTGAVSGKGASGPLRTASNSTGTNQYTISLLELTAPYALRWAGSDDRDQQVFLYTVATQPGVANITPLTTLLIAQLLGQDPAAAYAAFNASGGVRTETITDANIQAAQTKVTAYLQDVLGVQVKSGAASFVTSAFKAAAGDPMFDTLQALDAKLVSSGSNLATLAADVAALARLCIEEKISITVSGQQKELCPATKSANPEEADSSILSYVFKSPANDTLTVKVRGDAVLSGEYVTSAGQSFACSSVACGGIALGAPVSDLTRSITFNNADLAGAVLSGTLAGAIPGVALPVLPCDSNKFFVVLEDRTVIADCVDAFDPLGLGGTLNGLRGAAPSRAVYTFSSSSGANPAFPQVELVTDGNDSVVSVYFFQYDPATFIPSMRFACQGSACNGITLGPVTTNTDLGPNTPVLVRNVSFDNTVLAGLNEDGSPTDISASLKASFKTVYYADPFAPLVFPPQVSCASEGDTIAISVLSGPFNFCSSQSNRFATAQENGGLLLSTVDDGTFAPIEIVLRAGAVVQVTYNSPVNQQFSCSTDCTGVTVSAPNEQGHRTVTFEATTLRETQSFPLPGARTAVLSSGPLAFPGP
jgi:hypothetical protein